MPIYHEQVHGDHAIDATSAPDATAQGSEWLTVPADLFDIEPQARRLRSDFVQLCSLARPDQILDGLGAIWLMLDRAALWVASIRADLVANSTGFVERTCAALLSTIPRQMRSLTCLGRMSLDHLPTAMAAARAAFEAGLRLAWINAPDDQHQRVIRVLCLHNDEVRWKNAVASDYDRSSVGGDRWREAARAQSAVVSRGLSMMSSSSEPLPRVASVTAQLHELDLDRLYSSYRLASEYVHGGLSSVLEAEKINLENSPFGLYWPQDWYLAVSMCAWACQFSAYYADRGFNLGPLRGSMLAAELMLLSPGPGWRQDK